MTLPDNCLSTDTIIISTQTAENRACYQYGASKTTGGALFLTEKMTR
jgi:hypothetical protein